MVQPSGEGAVRCMKLAMDTVDQPVDYINTHGTSTPVGDVKELDAIKEAFKDRNRIPSFQLHQIPDRPFAGGCGCARVHLLAPNDGQQLHLRVREHRRA